MQFHLRKPNWKAESAGVSGGMTMAEAAPGADIILESYGDVDADLSRSLQAYGLLPGRRVRVLSQRPVTMVQIEQTELAIENQIARGIHVRSGDPGNGGGH